MPQIEVAFDIDANGILSVHASDKATNKEQSIRIEGSGGLSKDDIERMVTDAEAHAGEDKARRETIEKKNQLDSLVYNGEQQLSEHGDKLGAEEKQAIEEALANAKQALEGDDAAALDAAGPRLEQSLHKLAEVLYKAQAEAGPAPGADAAGSPGAGSDDDGDVIDAEYTEEKSD